MADTCRVEPLYLQSARVFELRQSLVVTSNRDVTLPARVGNPALRVRREFVGIRHAAQNLRAPDSLLELPAHACAPTRGSLSCRCAYVARIHAGNLRAFSEAEVLLIPRATGRELALAALIRRRRLRRLSPHAGEISLHPQPGFGPCARHLLRGRPLLLVQSQCGRAVAYAIFEEPPDGDGFRHGLCQRLGGRASRDDRGGRANGRPDRTALQRVPLRKSPVCREGHAPAGRRAQGVVPPGQQDAGSALPPLARATRERVGRERASWWD